MGSRRTNTLGRGTDINAIRQAVVTQAFRNSIGRRSLVLVAQFPFLFIGKIKDVISDYLLLQVETTHISELEDRVMRIHIDDIEVFYIEKDGKPIPKIKNGPGADKEGGENC